MRHVKSILAMALASIALTTLVVAQAGQPQAVPVEPIKDFEIVPKGELIKHTFEIRNDGDAPLQITDVRPACGCTVAKFDQVIKPGAIGTIHAEMKTDNFAGPVSKSIAVFTNDDDNPQIQLVIKAQIKPYIGVAPGFARYNYVQGETIGSVTQVLWAEDNANINVVDVRSPYPHLKVTHREATDDERNKKVSGKQWAFEFALDSQAPVGALSEYVTITLDHPEQKVVQIPISGFVRPRQHITPAELDLGPLQGASLPLKRTLHFTNFITDQIEVKSIDSTIEGLKATAVPSKHQPGYRFILELTMGPEMPKGNFDDVLQIHITDEQNPIVELPIKGSIL